MFVELAVKRLCVTEITLLLHSGCGEREDVRGCEDSVLLQIDRE